MGCTPQTSSPEFKVPSEIANLKNPVAATPASIDEGKRRYRSSDCVICHGVNGDGKGFESRNINMNLHDWRDPAVQAKFTDGELYYIMDKGKGADRGKMPAYHESESTEQLWQLVDYVRSFAHSSTNPAPPSGE
jgi:mono/diheme cytochrome c family protein